MYLKTRLWIVDNDSEQSGSAAVPPWGYASSPPAGGNPPAVPAPRLWVPRAARAHLRQAQLHVARKHSLWIPRIFFFSCEQYQSKFTTFSIVCIAIAITYSVQYWALVIFAFLCIGLLSLIFPIRIVPGTVLSKLKLVTTDVTQSISSTANLPIWPQIIYRLFIS